MPNHGGAMTLPGDKSDKFGKFILSAIYGVFYQTEAPLIPECVFDLGCTQPFFTPDSSNEFPSRLESTIFSALTQGVSGS